MNISCDAECESKLLPIDSQLRHRSFGELLHDPPSVFSAIRLMSGPKAPF